jgi:hypothetical protein
MEYCNKCHDVLNTKGIQFNYSEETEKYNTNEKRTRILERE